MAELTNVRSVLAVRDLEVSVDYYTRVLGLAVDFTAPGWAFLSRGSFRVMLGECSDATPAGELGDHSYVAYVTVDGIDELYAEVAGNGAETTSRPSDKPWGFASLAFARRTAIASRSASPCKDGHRGHP